MNEDLTTEEQPQGSEVAVGSEGKTELSLDIINETLGKDFPDVETALKSIKDTQSYVGKRKEDIIGEFKKAQNDSELSSRISSLESQLRDANFYGENPQYKPYKDIISKFGSNPADVIKDPVFIDSFKKVSAFDEIEKSKSILHSNPRLGKVTDKMTEAKADLAAGNSASAADKAVQAVLSAYEK
jgi:hypothetical protein